MSSASSKDRANQSLDLIVSTILPKLRGVKPGRNSTEWSFYCTLEHRKRNPSAVIWVDDEGWIRVHCYDCQRHAELREAVIAPAIRNGYQWEPRTMASPAQKQDRPDRESAATLNSWQRSEPIPLGDHPARRWTMHRLLWPPDIQAPASLRWIPAASILPGRHTGAGSLIALLAPPSEWQRAWPRLPTPSALEFIAIGQDGEPALDRPAEAGGLSKRTLGSKQGCFFILGCPIPSDLRYSVRVAEGVADSLALASRFPGPAVATMGDAGMRNEELALWLAQCPEGAVIHADNDTSGREAAGRLKAAITVAGGHARAVLPPHGKDAADSAALAPFSTSSQTWPAFADSLREEYGWPQWEAQRQATILMAEDLERL